MSPTTALIIVDLQNDFADQNGSLYVTGGDQIVAAINANAAAVEAEGGLVVTTQDWHPPVTPHFADHGGVWPVHCVRDTWGAELHPDLDVSAINVRKGVDGEDGYSAFSVRDPESGDESATELDSILRAHGVADVIVVGLALDVCVKATALDAKALGYAVTVMTDQSAAVNLEPDDGARAVEEMRLASITVQ